VLQQDDLKAIGEGVPIQTKVSNKPRGREERNRFVISIWRWVGKGGGSELNEA